MKMNRKSRGKNKSQRLAQDIMPIKSLEGVFIRLPNKKSNIVIKIDGVNDQLFTKEQLRILCNQLAEPLMSIGVPASIIRLPKVVDANASLVHIDSEIARLHAQIAKCKDARQKRTLSIRLQLLTDKIRKQAQGESQAGDRYEILTYIILQFDKDVPDEAAVRGAMQVKRLFSGHGREATINDVEANIEALRLFFTHNISLSDELSARPPVLVKGSNTNTSWEHQLSRQLRDALIINSITPDIIEHENYLEVGNGVCCVLTINGYNSEVDVGWADNLFIRQDACIAIRLDPCNVGKLRDSIDHHESQLSGQLVGAFRSRYISASKQDDIERQMRHGIEILKLIGDSNEKFFDTTISVVLHAANVDELEKQAEYFASSLRPAGMSYLRIPYNQLAAFFGASPLRADDPVSVERTSRPFPSHTLGYMNFIQQAGLDDMIGIAIGHDEQQGIVRLNTIETTSKRPNRNAVILGDSGHGKTVFAANLHILEHLMFGSILIWIDPENQISTPIARMGGQIINVGGTTGSNLSPFEPRAVKVAGGLSYTDDNQDDATDDSAQTTYVMSTTISYLLPFLMRQFEIDPNDKSTLEYALQIAYERYGITLNMTFDEYKRKNLSYPIMEDLYEVLIELGDKPSDKNHDRAACLRLSREFRSSAVGYQSNEWNQRSTLSIDSNLVCINTAGLGDDPKKKAAWYYNILSWVWTQVMLAPTQNVPIRIVVDEAHNIFADKSLEAANMIVQIVKRIRKRRGGITTITQEINDFLTGSDEVVKCGKSVFDLSTYRFLGHTEGTNLDLLTEVFKLEKNIRNRIEKADVGNFAVFAGTSDRTWVKADIDDWMFDLIGTKRMETK